MKAHDEIRRLMLIGLIVSVITVVLGELPIGYVTYPQIEDDVTGLLGMAAGSAELSYAQMACGALFGGVCIPMQYFGFEGAARAVALAGNRKSGKVIHWGALATAFWGGIVHVVCVALMFLCRAAGASAAAPMPQAVVDFSLYLVVPVSVVFMPVYYAMCAALLLAIARGKTMYPRWAAAFNPLTGSFLMNALPLIAPNTPLINALGMANMGVGSVLTFGALLALTPGKE